MFIFNKKLTLLLNLILLQVMSLKTYASFEESVAGHVASQDFSAPKGQAALVGPGFAGDSFADLGSFIKAASEVKEDPKEKALESLRFLFRNHDIDSSEELSKSIVQSFEVKEGKSASDCLVTSHIRLSSDELQTSGLGITGSFTIPTPPSLLFSTLDTFKLFLKRGGSELIKEFVLIKRANRLGIQGVVSAVKLYKKRDDRNENIISLKAIETVSKPRVKSELFELCPMAIQTLSTVSKLHAAGISHYDLKPENILYDGSNYILTDFGESELFNSHQGHSISIQNKYLANKGTPATRAPELSTLPAGLGVVDPKSDLWSLAMTFVMMIDFTEPLVIDLNMPFKTVKYIEKSLHRQFQNPSDRMIIEVIKKMLKIERTERITAKEALDQFKSICKE